MCHVVSLSARGYFLVHGSCLFVSVLQKGEKKGDPQVGRLLMSCLDSLPSMEANRFDELFNNGLQDKLALVYLFDLTRTQLSLAERLQSNV